jgi:TetR/AcrR family transcriptional regulator, copper-responsive repressor
MRDSTKLPSKPRGRPRAFEPDDALDALTTVFWTHGFAAASLDALAASAGVNRPSLYAAFGDKRTMYLRAIEKVAAQLEAFMVRSLAGDRPLRDELTTFYEESVRAYLAGEPGPRGCLIVCTAPSAAIDEPEIKDALRGVLTAIDRAFEKRFASARASGELAADTDVRALARIASSVLHSLAVRARAGEGRAQLLALARAAVTLMAGGLPELQRRTPSR